MRTEPTTAGALTARAIAGSRAVLLGFDAPPRPDLLGFAVRRTDLVTGHAGWLPNFLRFKANEGPDGPSGTNRNPLQAFLWGDYTTQPGQRLRYEVTAMVGSAAAPEPDDTVTLDVVCEPADDGGHGIHFNRGVAGSQAYTRKFGDQSPLDVPAAAEWMSRGLEEALLAFIARAEGPGWALRGAFYEFFHPPVLRALHRAARAGAEVELAISCPSSAGWPDYPAAQNIDAIRAFTGKRGVYKGLCAFVKPRSHSKAIAHNKFLVLLKDGVPVGVWTGSTNVTPGAFYGQSNVGHVVWDSDLAQVFLGYWAAAARRPARGGGGRVRRGARGGPRRGHQRAALPAGEPEGARRLRGPHPRRARSRSSSPARSASPTRSLPRSPSRATSARYELLEAEDEDLMRNPARRSRQPDRRGRLPGRERRLAPVPARAAHGPQRARQVRAHEVPADRPADRPTRPSSPARRTSPRPRRPPTTRTCS